MAKYLKLFETHTQYESFTQTEEFVRPNVSYCTEENEVHYNPLPPMHNGHEYVDLGLPSGTKWAKMNVGANIETDYGNYFMWGSTTPNTADECTWTNAPFNNGSSAFDETYFNSVKDTVCPNGVLAKEYDAAHVNWGGDWHMPTKEQCEELLNATYVTNAWVTDYQGSGVNGRLFTSVSNGNTMFVPAAGGCEGGGVDNVGVYGVVWASALNSESVENAWGFYFNSGGAGVGIGGRCYGLSVRGVVGQMDEITV